MTPESRFIWCGGEERENKRESKKINEVRDKRAGGRKKGRKFIYIYIYVVEK